MAWDPEKYLGFDDHRARPGKDLLARIPDIQPETIVDLGCGPGNLTAQLLLRWPSAVVFGVDSSVEMLSKASADHTGIAWVRSDIETWEPSNPLDLIHANASLHWVDDHHHLFPRLMSWLRPGGVLAVQTPDNHHAPTHTCIASLVSTDRWAPKLAHLYRHNPVSEPGEYRSLLGPLSGWNDIWQTTYHHELSGTNPVLEWVTGSVLRPLLAALSPSEGCEFAEELSALYAEKYPPQSDGRTVLPFRRLFMIASRL